MPRISMSKEERKERTRQNNLCRKWEKKHGHDRRTDGILYNYNDVIGFEKDRQTLKERAKKDSDYMDELRDTQCMEVWTSFGVDRDYKINQEHKKRMFNSMLAPFGSEARKYFDHHYKQEEAQRQFEKEFREKQATKAMIKKYGTKWETVDGKIEVYTQLREEAKTDKTIFHECQREHKIKYYQNLISNLENSQ